MIHSFFAPSKRKPNPPPPSDQMAKKKTHQTKTRARPQSNRDATLDLNTAGRFERIEKQPIRRSKDGVFLLGFEESQSRGGEEK